VCVNVSCDQMLGRPEFQVFVCVCARVYVCVYCVFRCVVRTLASLEFQVWVSVCVRACVCESMCGCNKCVNVIKCWRFSNFSLVFVFAHESACECVGVLCV